MITGNLKTIVISSLLSMVCGIGVVPIAAGDVKNSDSDQRVSRGSGKPAKGKSNRIVFEDALIKVITIPRTREQMKAFYEGRGFPKPAITAIGEACFMTVVIHNKTDDVLWLELDNWRFGGVEAEVKRLHRTFWKQRWESLEVPMANRSTFGWTLLPERRDLRPDEGVGGNITLMYTEQPFKLTAKFLRGAHKRKSPLTVQLDQLQCVK